MRNKKRIIMTASLLCAVLSAASAAGFAADSNINISFVVGENKININGVETEITAPYIVDDTTFV
ncbi:MAG: hypothetical protein ACI4EA_07005, partial [Candidatus Ornithomonoglobus sp.]